MKIDNLLGREVKLFWANVKMSYTPNSCWRWNGRMYTYPCSTYKLHAPHDVAYVISRGYAICPTSALEPECVAVVVDGSLVDVNPVHDSPTAADGHRYVSQMGVTGPCACGGVRFPSPGPKLTTADPKLTAADPKLTVTDPKLTVVDLLHTVRYLVIQTCSDVLCCRPDHLSLVPSDPALELPSPRDRRRALKAAHTKVRKPQVVKVGPYWSFTLEDLVDAYRNLTVVEQPCHLPHLGVCKVVTNVNRYNLVRVGGHTVGLLAVAWMAQNDEVTAKDTRFRTSCRNPRCVSHVYRTARRKPTHNWTYNKAIRALKLTADGNPVHVVTHQEFTAYRIRLAVLNFDASVKYNYKVTFTCEHGVSHTLECYLESRNGQWLSFNPIMENFKNMLCSCFTKR